MLIGSVVDDVALIDVAGAGELCTARTNVGVTFLVEEEVGSAAVQLCPRNELPSVGSARLQSSWG
jgi:hypothetical protein